MSKITFKEFNQFLVATEKTDAEFAEYLEEGFFSDLFGGGQKRDDARVEKYKHLLAHKDPRVQREAERGLKLLVQKGNEKAKSLASAAEKAKASRNALEKAKVAYAQAVAQASDTGSSKAWRSETGSISRPPKGPAY